MKELITRILAGETELFSQLIERHQSKVFSLCRHLLGNDMAADDAAQDTFLKIYNALTRFKYKSSFETWAYRIAYNTCLDHLRREKRKPARSLDEMLEKNHAQVQALLEADQNRADLSELAQNLLAAIPEDYRILFSLSITGGLSYKEIAALQNCSIDSVKGRLKRARIFVNQKLRHFFDDAASKE